MKVRLNILGLDVATLTIDLPFSDSGPATPVSAALSVSDRISKWATKRWARSILND